MNHLAFPRNDRATPRHRRGMAVYVSVLMTTLIVSLLGMTGIAVMRIQRNEHNAIQEILHARWNARSAVQLALAVLADDSQWRTNYTSGVETSLYSLGDDATGTLSWIVADSDGDLTDSDTDLTLQGIGRVDETVQAMQVSLNAEKLTCLEVAMHAEGPLLVDGAELKNDHTVSSNDVVQAFDSANVFGDVEAVNDVTGGDYADTTTTGITPRTLPGANVFNYYLANGTAIDFSALNSGDLKETLLSPEYNPYGATNALGIYVIDCGGQRFRMHDCRVVGTLVLINPAADSEIGSDHVYWEPAVANFPSLLVSGSIHLRTEYAANALAESNWGNLNPTGTPFPYAGGVDDEDAMDIWPSELKGLYYASENIVIDHRTSRITGVVVAGGHLLVQSDVTMNFSSTFYDNPPPGFTSNELQPVSGSWTRAEAP